MVTKGSWNVIHRFTWCVDGVNHVSIAANDASIVANHTSLGSNGAGEKLGHAYKFICY